VIASVIQKSKAENLNKVVEMLAAHEADLGLYLTTDPKGRQLPGYLRQLSQHLHTQHGAALQEITRLQENIDHIKEIVVMQQSHAKVSGMVESLTLTSLVDDALRLNQGSLQRDGVEVIKDYADILPMEVEKHKILQILVNLIRNAKHACDESANAEKRIVIQVVGGSDRISVSVIDNGVGIPAENLKRIFGHGFTTRKEGHGFGLHSSALAAKEMGGFITVESEGPGRGAKFTLDLPYVRTITNSGNIRRLIEPARAA
jgi:signal transduction histidine kinase